MDFKATCQKCSSSVMLRHLVVTDTNQKCPQCGEAFSFDLYREPIRSQFEKEVVESLSQILTSMNRDDRDKAPDYLSLKILATVYRVAGVAAIPVCLIGSIGGRGHAAGEALLGLLAGAAICLCSFAGAAILDAIRDIARNSFK
jgi:hypothetical protein